MTDHLTEAERQGAADDTLPSEARAAVTAHLAQCEPCAADVARLRAFLSRVHDAPAQTAPPEEAWPAIRARIEQGKVIDLPGAGIASRRPRWLAPALAAAAIVLVVLTDRTPQPASAPGTTPGGAELVVRTVVDSSALYQQQVTELLNDLELRRSMLRPEAAAAIDGDLQVVDQAIAELKGALARDPNNPTLRQLLASTYRQKLDILKRVTNAS